MRRPYYVLRYTVKRTIGWPETADGKPQIKPAGPLRDQAFLPLVKLTGAASSPDCTPPAWPAAPGHQQMRMHIDAAVDELAAAVAGAIDLGATLAGFQSGET